MFCSATMDRGWWRRFAAIFDNNKDMQSANEYILPILNVNSSSRNFRLIKLLLNHILNSLSRF